MYKQASLVTLSVVMLIVQLVHVSAEEQKVEIANSEVGGVRLGDRREDVEKKIVPLLPHPKRSEPNNGIHAFFTMPKDGSADAIIFRFDGDRLVQVVLAYSTEGAERRGGWGGILDRLKKTYGDPHDASPAEKCAPPLQATYFWSEINLAMQRITLIEFRVVQDGSTQVAFTDCNSSATVPVDVAAFFDSMRKGLGATSTAGLGSRANPQRAPEAATVAAGDKPADASFQESPAGKGQRLGEQEQAGPVFAGLAFGLSVREALAAYGNPPPIDAPPMFNEVVTKTIVIRGNPRLKGASETTLSFIDDKLFRVALRFGLQLESLDRFQDKNGVLSADAIFEDSTGKSDAILEMLQEKYGRPRTSTHHVSAALYGGSKRDTVPVITYTYDAGPDLAVTYSSEVVTAVHKQLAAVARTREAESAGRMEKQRIEKGREAVGGTF